MQRKIFKVTTVVTIKSQNSPLRYKKIPITNSTLKSSSSKIRCLFSTKHGSNVNTVSSISRLAHLANLSQDHKIIQDAKVNKTSLNSQHKLGNNFNLNSHQHNLYFQITYIQIHLLSGVL